ncbi:hypothetical protein DFJ77DRAFT_444170 [Powellomyces hirtus]|nr:hypothetical protein DFJ77DRAFT_444170 [Powellomyces hirtus]
MPSSLDCEPFSVFPTNHDVGITGPERANHRKVLGTNLRLPWFEDIDLFLDKYVEGYLRANRGLSNGSIVNHITCGVDALKFRSAKGCRTAQLKPKANFKIARLMQTRTKSKPLWKGSATTRDKVTHSSGIVSEQVLEAVRRQRLVIKGLWDLSAGGEDLTYELVAEVQHYMALAFYTCLPLGRSREIRLILGCILTKSESQESLHNHISELHGRKVLIVKRFIADYKNKQRWGRDTVELPADKFTTSMDTSPSEDHQRLRDSEGRAMRHTSRIQQNVYNNILSLKRKQKRVEFATQVFRKAVIDVECSGNGAMPVLITSPIGAIVGFTDERKGAALKSDVLLMVLWHEPEASGVLTPDATKVLRKSLTKLTCPVNYEVEGPDYVVRTSVVAVEDLLDKL